ncbi:hypothetical protein CLAIMM_06678 [Cladophialophora immunda]|nr:hypothetical protein CLAIMM_06678 [Cladophialophora immunda]
MSDDMTHQSREGWSWTGESGLKSGLPSVAVVKPETNVQNRDKVFDVAIIGAGYAGLTAARDLSTSGHSTLLLEARDRIGGRTWTSMIDGTQYELGGQYVHWGQPHLWRELSRYSMQKEVDPCVDPSKGLNSFTLVNKDGSKSMSREEQAAILDSAIQKFINVDGNFGRMVMPFPHDPTIVPDAVNLDAMSIKDRFDQIKADLDPLEQTILEGLLMTLTGGKPESSGFYEIVRLWALCSYSLDGLIGMCAAFKLRHGQSAFARRFFREALDTGGLSYAFNCTVTSVKDDGSKVKIGCTEDLQFQARRLICTVPLNVLSSIAFNPPVQRLDNETLSAINGNRSTKLHIVVSSDSLSSWDGLTYPDNKLIHAAGESTTPLGDSHVVCFGAAYNHLDPEDNVDETLAAVRMFHEDIKVKSMVFHDWCKDDYSRGGWCSFNATMSTKYLDTLQGMSNGRVILASSDWASGWRGFIDGAIEEGTRAAFVVKNVLANETRVNE